MYTIGKHSELKWFKKCKKGIFKNWKQLKKTTFLLVYALVKEKGGLVFISTVKFIFPLYFGLETREKREKKVWFSSAARKSHFFMFFTRF